MSHRKVVGGGGGGEGGGGCFLHTILFLVPISVVKADFLKANRKAVSKRLIRLLKGCYM